MKIDLESATKLVKEVLAKAVVPENSIDIISDSMQYADRRGLTSHGIGRLPLYVRKIEAGHLNPRDEVKSVMDSEAVSILDAQNGFGQVAAKLAVEIGMKKASRYGVAAIAVRNSNNFGTAGYFGQMAAVQGMAAMIFANASPAIAPTGGRKPIFGTNPICFAFPGGEESDPIVFDMSTSVVARGKIRLAAKNGDKIPDTWATDENGVPTEDPKAALNGTLQPVGGIKGYGLSLFVDIFAGLLAGSAYGGNVRQLSDMEHNSGNGHLFILIDIGKFLERDAIGDRVSSFKQVVKSCGNEGDVFLPGELGNLRMESHQNYIELSDKQVEEINNTALSSGVSARLENYDERRIIK